MEQIELPPQASAPVRRLTAEPKFKVYQGWLLRAQELSQALCQAQSQNNAFLVSRYNQQLDALNVEIFRSLRRKSQEDAFREGGLSISELSTIHAPGRNMVNLATTLLTIIVSQQNDYFSVGKPMNAYQVSAAVDDIIDRFGYMTLEEVSTTFAIARRRERIYDRLDPNILLGWLYAYDSLRDSYCESQAESNRRGSGTDGLAAVLSSSDAPRAGSMSMSDYVSWLESEVSSGNEKAAEALECHRTLEEWLRSFAKKEEGFLLWKKSNNY